MEQMSTVYRVNILCPLIIKLIFNPTFGGFLSSSELSKVSIELLDTF